jgi:hypothetical protein
MGFQQQKKFGGPGKGIGSLKAAAKQRHWKMIMDTFVCVCVIVKCEL